jgi:two-component system sensor kinase FixL
MIGLSVSSLVSIQERTELGYSLRYLADNRALELMGRQQEMLGLHKDLGEFPLEMSLSTWRDSEGKCFYTAIIRDVSERKRIEKERQELVQSNKDLEEFALIASHDLQEPLRKIVFYTERFTHENEENLSRESLEHVSKVIGCTHRMQNLINDLLMYSRVSVRGKQFSRVALKQVVNDVLSDLECVIQETGATIRVDDLPVIEADSSQMRQLFGNLIENALKYRQAGVSPKIWIYGNVVDKQLQVGSVPLHGTGNGAAPEKARFAEIRVEDNGIGFEEKYLDRIFNVFQRLHGREQYSGTGIGLATCRRIVERHNGSITATSKPGIGSTFIVSLPVYRHHPSLQAR